MEYNGIPEQAKRPYAPNHLPCLSITITSHPLRLAHAPTPAQNRAQPAMHLDLKRAMRHPLAIDTNIAVAPAHDQAIRTDLLVVDMRHVEKRVSFNRAHGADGGAGGQVAADAHEVETAVGGQGGGEEVCGGGHVGHVAGVKGAEVGVGDQVPVLGEGVVDGAVLEGREARGGVGRRARIGAAGLRGAGAVGFAHRGFGGVLDFDGHVGWVDFLVEYAHEDAPCEARAAHPAQVLGGEVGFGDDADGLGEEGEGASGALGDGRQVEGRAQALDHGEGGEAGVVVAVEVEAGGVA